MSITSIGDTQRGSFLGSCSFYRRPDGTISAMLTEMAPWVIEEHENIPDRFNQFAAWLVAGADDLIAQGESFEEIEP